MNAELERVRLLLDGALSEGPCLASDLIESLACVTPIGDGHDSRPTRAILRENRAAWGIRSYLDDDGRWIWAKAEVMPRGIKGHANGE